MSLDSFSLRIEIISRTRRVEGLKVGERSLPIQKLNSRHHLFEDMKDICVCVCVCMFSPMCVHIGCARVCFHIFKQKIKKQKWKGGRCVT